VRRRERSWTRDPRGIAEVVGTLMLILIVVAASIALAAFIASYQKQLQAQQAEAQQRSLESLKVLNLAQVNTLPTPNESKLANFSFLLASEFVNPSTISSFSVNGNPLRFYSETPLAPATGPTVCFNSSTPFVLPSFEEVLIKVNTDPNSLAACGYSFFSTLQFPISGFVQVGIFTILQNTFTTVFLPPTAVALVSSLSEFVGGGSASGFVSVPVLDGSHSFQSGNASITSWNWSIANTTAGSSETWTVLGEQLVAPFVSTGYGNVYTYSVALTVANSDGLLAVSMIAYTYHP
jgi:flagellin-like protein